MLESLYQQAILDHSENPRNAQLPAGADRCAEGYNPLCGDRVRLALQIEHERVAAIGFEGHGCALSLASASMMTEAVRGLNAEEIAALAASFDALLRGEQVDRDRLGPLSAFGGVHRFPLRRRCAKLAWDALREAIDGPGRDERSTTGSVVQRGGDAGEPGR